MESKPHGRWTEEENIEYRSMQLGHWDTSGYPNWPDNLVEQGIAKVEHKNILNSVFWLPLKFLTHYLTAVPNIDGPLVIQETGSAARVDRKIRLTVHKDRINLIDPEEIIEIDRWDMS